MHFVYTKSACRVLLVMKGRAGKRLAFFAAAHINEQYSFTLVYRATPLDDIKPSTWK